MTDHQRHTADNDAPHASPQACSRCNPMRCVCDCHAPEAEGLLRRFWRWMNACDGHCYAYDAADAYIESLMTHGTTEGALERAGRCYHEYRREPYPDETRVTPPERTQP